MGNDMKKETVEMLTGYLMVLNAVMIVVIVFALLILGVQPQ